MMILGSGNFTILNSLCAGFLVASIFVPNDAVRKPFIKRIKKRNTLWRLARMALEHAGKDRLSRTNKHIIIQKAQAAVSGNLVQPYQRYESRTRRFPIP